MANEIDDIVQNIVLSGDEGVSAAFDRMQQSGERAFEAISQAIEHSVFSFTGLATAVTGVVAAIGIAGVGMFEFVKSTEEAVSGLSDLADQTGSTTEEITGLRAAFAAGGVGPQTLETAFKRLSVTIQQSWAEIKKASREGADQLKSDALSVQSAELAAANAQKTLSNFNRDQALQRRQDLQGIAGAQLKVDELNAKALKNAGVDTTDLERQLAIERDQLELDQARLALAEAKKKKADDLANAENERIKAENAAEQTQLALRQARRKEEDDRKNDVDNIIEATQRVANGDKTAFQSINASAENVAKGIIGAAGASAKSLGELRGDITDLSSPAPGVKETFLEIGKVLQNIDDPALKTAVAFRLLGRTVSQEFLNVLSDPAKLEAFQKRIESLGLGVDSLDKKISEDFRSALFTFENDVQLVSVKLATAFGPAFTNILNSLDEALINNKNNIVAFASSIAGQVQPIVDSFIRVLSGAPDHIKDQWLLDYTEKIGAFATGIGQLGEIVTTAFGLIITGAGKVGEALNSVFGTNINAFDVLFAAWITRITIGFTAATAAAATAATGIEVAFAPVLVSLGLIAAAVYAAVKAWETYKAIVNGHGDAILEGTLERLHAIAEFLTGDFQKAINDWQAANKKQDEAEKTIDDVDKQVADNQKNRQEELTKAERDARNKNLDEERKAAAARIDSAKQAADGMITQTTRSAAASKDVVEQSKRDVVDIAKLQQEHPNLVFAIGEPIRGAFSTSTKDKKKRDTGPTDEEISADIQAVMDQVAREGGGPRILHPPNAASDIDVAPQPITPGSKTYQDQQKTMSDAVRDGAVEAAKITGADSFNHLRSGFGPTDIPKGDIASLTDLNNLEHPPQEPLSGLTSFGAGGLPLDSLFERILNSLGLPPAGGGTAFSDFFKNAITNPGGIQGNPNEPPSAPDQNQTPTDQNQTPPTDQSQQLTNNLDQQQQQLDTAVSNVSSAADSLASALSSLASSIGSTAVPTPAPVTAATGGLITGPGSGTSDSILARLSDGEYVTKSRATAFWGLDFMHAINNMQMPRFSMGGLAGLLSPSLPRFARGGLVGGDSSGMPHLGTVDLSTNHGTVRVTVDRNSISQLRKAAVMKNIGSSTAPGWVR